MSPDVVDALAQAAEHRTVARTLAALSLVFLTFAGLFIPGRQWAPLLCAATGVVGFALMARREWAYCDQWAGCARLWAEEDRGGLL